MGYKERQEAYERARAEKQRINDTWHRVELPPNAIRHYDLGDIQDWVEQNCNGNYKRGWVTGSDIPQFQFELESDAMWFALKWG